jgi:SPASM domain peptide maturase of grasp-with-spasm system
MSELRLKKYGCCYTIKGFSRSTICDLQYGTTNFIPNDLYDLLQNHEGKTLNQIYNSYNNEENETINEYIDFLITNEYAFWTSEPDNFPPMNKKWSFPGLISNILIDINPTISLLTNIEPLHLDELGAIALQIRITDYIAPESLDKLLQLFSSTRIQSIEIVIKYDDYIKDDKFTKLLNKHLRVNYVIIYSSPTNEKILNEFHALFFMTENLTQGTSKGPTSEAHFAVNKNIFMESQFQNTYFNKKLYIDEYLNIKNTPETEILGNLLHDPLLPIINNANFTKYWEIKKDDTKVCKDCEFRYFCVDSRLPNFNASDSEYYFDSSCNYNPYKNTWELN